MHGLKGVKGDTLGHTKGDEVLSEFGREFIKIFRKNDIVGGVGGYEFIVVLKDYGNIELISGKANEVRQIMRKEYCSFKNKDIKVKTSASIGIALYSDNGNDFGKLYKSANIALYISKKRGREQYTFFDKNMEKA